MASRNTIIGNESNFWIYSPDHKRFDLTRPKDPSNSPAKGSLEIQTTTNDIIIDPAKSALVVIDMQNFFLSVPFGRAKGGGHAAAEQVANVAVPAARKTGMQVVWMNWGLTDEDIDKMPPATRRTFGFTACVGDSDEKVPVDRNGAPRTQMYTGLGSECGSVTLEDGTKVDAGKLLMRDQWNTELYPPLDKLYAEGKKLDRKPDVWMHKNRMSGMWGASTKCEEFLRREGIHTLLFAGVNTDQCVNGTLLDSFTKGFDCIMLSDGCATTSPEFSKLSVEFNAERSWGFVIDCAALVRAAAKMS